MDSRQYDEEEERDVPQSMEERTAGYGTQQPYVSPSTGQKSRHSRVTSTVAQSFAADLDSMFGLGMGTSGGIDTLSQTVEEKKANVTSGQSELEQLEARLRETEQRLAKVSRQNSPSRQANTGAARDRLPGEETAQKQGHPLAQRPTFPDDRPPTGGRPQPGRENTGDMMSEMPGGLPRDEYVMVDKGNVR